MESPRSRKNHLTKNDFRMDYYIFSKIMKVKSNCKWDALRDLVPFVKFRKREKHPWWSATSSKVAG